MTYDARVLNALLFDEFLIQRDVIKRARVAPETGADVLAELVAAGKVEAARLYRPGRGNRAKVYRRVREAA